MVPGRRAPKIVIGTGSVLMRDDAIGCVVAERMARLPLPDDVEVFDAGTSGVGALCMIERREKVVLVDAIDAGAEPGAVFRLSPSDLAAFRDSSLSLHDLHVLDALQETAILGTHPIDVVVLAVQVGEVSLALGLTPPVRAAVEKVIRLALRELGLPESLLDENRAAGGADEDRRERGLSWS